jgi:polar amino acid transport system substrate-binding protein
MVKVGLCRIRAFFVSTVVTLVVLSAHSPIRAENLADIKARGELIMLCFPHSTSEFIRQSGGDYEGMDYEILKTFAAAHKVELTVLPVPEFSALIPWLLEGKGDVIASAFSITEERREKVDYSESYFPVVIMVVAKKSVVINDVADLTDRRAAVVPGTSREAFIKKKVTGVAIVPVEKTRLAYEAVLTGNADYAPVDSTSAMTDLQDYPDLDVAFSFPDKMGYGFAVGKGSDLAGALSEHISRLRSSGIFYKMLSRAFGSQAVELVKSIEGGTH